ncbi:hypothetical protein AIP98_21185 [Salmonella enterica]|nr:hypothetical protein [Salmonella enterica]EDW9721277.1 hypothetical protein [Salmonella enterica]EID9742483.1 hypothetical protein [Salmonella enterica]
MNDKTPNLLTIAASAFTQKVKDTVTSINNGEKALVSLVAVCADRWYLDGKNGAQKGDSGGAETIQNFVNALSDYPTKQKAAAKLFAKFVPVEIVISDEGSAKADNKIKLSALTDDQKANYKAAIEAFKASNFPSLAAAVKSDGKKDNSFKPVKLENLKTKITTTAAKLVATALLSDANQTLEDVKAALAAAISGLTAAEIETAKAEILAKKPLKEVPKAA